MTYHQAKLRSAITAVVAVLALSSTSLFAQDVGTAADAPVETPPVAAPDPLAPEPAPAATDTAAENAVPPAPRPKVEAAPAKNPRLTASRDGRASRTAGATRSAAPPPADTPVAEVPIVVAAAPVAETIQVAEPMAPPPVETQPAAEPTTPVPAELAAAVDALMTDERLQFGAGAAAVLLATGGMAMAIRRRKRRKEEERIEEAKWALIEAAPEVETQAEAQPGLARAPAPVHDLAPGNAADPAGRSATKLANGFDLSQFGRHVQAAYRGPTPDNSSVSLEYRLRRASFLDQKEKDAREAAARAAKVPTKGNWESRPDADFLFRRAGAKNGAKPEYQG